MKNPTIKMVSVPHGIIDTTIIVKGLVKPRRKKKDEVHEEQVKIHSLCSKVLEEIEKQKSLIIPSIALIETAAVVSRLTNNDSLAEEAVSFLKSVSKRIIHDYEFLNEALKVGIQTKTSGFDVVFLTCSKMMDLPLITDDERLVRAGKRYGFDCIAIRDFLEEKNGDDTGNTAE